ncbi:hypothetical protein DPSP01_007800 [Paraphaeosphaeria sporulosa]|uniref:BZIP domain-containing protein n=1 Tax=Paraphaeosphaeria sporulosa TaxID=1460663 RepID=A0A177CKS2_9PLEO|nr:uncharacterized protein CC84DRAFT_657576 [Paraphaeosphaeria sporulosa]OAG07468.1 hypothetical protein CC84DRAFT_657576 [Paraphaeosphaeria sporulosa]
MSGYNGRRGPNVSAYVANLNTIVPDEVQESNTDFDIFLETELFDQYDSGDLNFNPALDIGLNSIDTPAPAPQANPTLPAPSVSDDAKMDFNLNGDFQFADFSTFAQPLSIDPSIQNPLPASRTYSIGNAFSPASSVVSPIIPGFDAAAGKKRKHESAVSVSADTPSQPPTDESARNAAEEDKRRRNTAASARFRIKKKQREQALEKTAKEMTDRVSVLETRIQQLETENTWLKGLITEKNGGKASPSEIQARLSKREESERSNGNRTDGVGTKAAKA